MYQQIDYKCRTLAYVIPRAPLPDKTTFLTSEECTQQVGYIVYPAGGEIARHVHRPVKRELVGTTEVLLILKGHCVIEFFDDDSRGLVATRHLREGDLIIIVAGGHSFKMIEDTVMLEVKQGPYPGMDAEKEKF